MYIFLTRKIAKILFSRNTNYISSTAISILTCVASAILCAIMFLVGYLIRKKKEQLFPSEESNKQKVKNINLDNSPDKNVETSYEKKENEKKEPIFKQNDQEKQNNQENNTPVKLSENEEKKTEKTDQEELKQLLNLKDIVPQKDNNITR